MNVSDLPPVTHFAEGSVLGPLNFRIVGQIIPSKVPFIIRPIVRFAFDKIDELGTGPDLKRQGKLVRPFCPLLLYEVPGALR